MVMPCRSPLPKGGRPVDAESMVAHHAHQSVASLASWPRSSSGAVYPAVPETRPVRVRCSSSSLMAMPKSMRMGP